MDKESQRLIDAVECLTDDHKIIRRTIMLTVFDSSDRDWWGEPNYTARHGKADMMYEFHDMLHYGDEKLDDFKDSLIHYIADKVLDWKQSKPSIENSKTYIQCKPTITFDVSGSVNPKIEVFFSFCYKN